MIDTFRVVCRRMGDGWFAECLDYDMVASGDSVEDVTAGMAGIIAGQFFSDVKDGRDPFVWLRLRLSRDAAKCFEDGERLEEVTIPLYEMSVAEGDTFSAGVPFPVEKDYPREVRMDMRLHSTAVDSNVQSLREKLAGVNKVNQNLRKENKRLCDELRLSLVQHDLCRDALTAARGDVDRLEGALREIRRRLSFVLGDCQEELSLDEAMSIAVAVDSAWVATNRYRWVRKNQ